MTYDEFIEECRIDRSKAIMMIAAIDSGALTAGDQPMGRPVVDATAPLRLSLQKNVAELTLLIDDHDVRKNA